MVPFARQFKDQGLVQSREKKKDNTYEICAHSMLSDTRKQEQEKVTRSLNPVPPFNVDIVNLKKGLNLKRYLSIFSMCVLLCS